MNTTVYTGRATNWSSILLSGFLLVPLVGMAGPSGSIRHPGALFLLLALVGLLAEVITASDVRASAGPQGVAVNWGLAGWPRATYALGEIKEASAVTVPWWAVSFGFWWTPSRTVCTVRSGPALRLELHTGRRVTITVPDPHAAVAALGLVDDPAAA